MLALKWPIGADPALDIPPFPREDDDLDLDVPPPPRSWRARSSELIEPVRSAADDMSAFDYATDASLRDGERWIDDRIARFGSVPSFGEQAATADEFDIPAGPGVDGTKTGASYDFSGTEPEPVVEDNFPQSYDRVEEDYYRALSQAFDPASDDTAETPQSHDRTARDHYDGPISRDRDAAATDGIDVSASYDRDLRSGDDIDVPISADRVEQDYEVPISYDRVEPDYEIPASYDRMTTADPEMVVPVSYDRLEKEYEVPISHDRVEKEYEVPISYDRVEKEYEVPISHDRVEKEADVPRSYDRVERDVVVPISRDRVEREVDVPMSYDRRERDVVVPISHERREREIDVPTTRDRVEREIDVPISHDRVDRSYTLTPVPSAPGRDEEPPIEFLELDENGFSDQIQSDRYEIDLGTTVNPDEELEQSLLHGTVSSQLEAVEFGSEVAAILAEMVTADAGEAALADSIRLRFTSWLDCATDTIVTHVVDPCLRNRDGTETPFHGLLSSGPSPERSLSIDCIMVEQLKQSAPALFADGTKLDLCLPVSASTLLRPKFRSQYMALWSDMNDTLRRSIRLNAYGLPAGAASQSGDLFSWMRSLSGRAPNVRIPPRVELMAPLGGFAVHAVAINYEKWFDELGPHLFVETLLRLIKQARQHRLRVALTKLPDIRAIRIGFAAGVDFLEISQFESIAELPRRPVKINRAMLVGGAKPR